MKKLIFCLALLCPVITKAQPKPLTVGDTLPPQVWRYLKQQVPALSNNLKQSFLLLDFWATWCPACIKETLPLDSLLSRHKAGKFSIIMVAAEPASKVKSFLAARSMFQKLSLPFITEDTLLRRLFPHRYLPHQVWIAPGGKIQAITAGGLITDSILTTWFAGSRPNLRLKTDPPEYDLSQPMFINTNGHDSSALLYRSQWAGRLLGRGGSSGYTFINGYKKLYFINRPALSLYAAALGFPSNHVVLENISPSQVVLFSSVTEEQKNTLLYSYELTVPQNTPQQKIQELMVSDLNRYLGCYGRLEKRIMPCLSLQTSGTFLQTGLPPVNDRQYWSISNKPISHLLQILNSSYTEGTGLPIIIDETGITTPVTIILSYNAKENLSRLKEELSQYGLQLIETQKEVEVFVLSKNQ